MRLLFRFSGEHPSLPEAELRGVLKGERLRWRLYGRDDERKLLIVDVDSANASFALRLALTKKAVEVFCINRRLEAVAGAIYPRIKGARSFRESSESNTVERELGALLHEKGLRVSLERPEKTVDVVRFRGGWAAGFGIPLDRDFESRHPLRRPFFHPTSLRPKTARMLVNLSAVRKGDTLLDPFCGAGGILIEAGLMGLKATGRDIDFRMLEGCRRNLGHFGVRAVLERRSALEKNGGVFDSIVTDPPYGKSSSTLGLSPRRLYCEFVRNMKSSLKRGGRLVFVLPEPYRPSHRGFKLAGRFRIRVHKSLVRVVWVLQRD